VNPTIAGLLFTFAIAAGGWWLSARGQRTDSMSTLVTAALAIADRHAADEHDCRTELAQVRADAATRDERLDKIAADLALCTDKHDRAERALIAAGIPLD